MISLFINYSKLLAWMGIYYFQKSDIIEDIIIKNINECGCVFIKFTQWITPFIENNNLTNFPLKKLESLYENCDTHSLNHTKEIFEKEFKYPLESKYKIQKLIASASMGQVYKIMDNQTKETFAMKVLHPKLEFQINI